MKTHFKLFFFICFFVSKTYCLRLQNGNQNYSAYFQNPLVNVNTPDPGVIFYDNAFYAATTSGDDVNAFPIRKSTDLRNWEIVGYIFPQNNWPSWAVSDFWAPEIHLVNEVFLVCFVARNKAGYLSIGLAKSSNITGPYTDFLGNPLITSTYYDTIDPTLFFDTQTNSLYIIWKQYIDPSHCTSNCAAPIVMNQLDIQNFNIINNSNITLLEASLNWEDNWVEAPWVYYSNTTQYYYLFYSASVTFNSSYCVGVARSQNISGPYEKLDQPVLESQNGANYVGPGHCSVLKLPDNFYLKNVQNQDENEMLMFHHCFLTSEGSGTRFMMAEKVFFNNDSWPYIVNNYSDLDVQYIP